MSFGITSVTNTPFPQQAANTTQTQPNPFTSPNSPFANLNLTPQQQQQIQSIFSQAQSSPLTPSQLQSQLNSVLSPQQQQTLQSDLQSMKGHHHHHHGGGSSSSSGSNSLLSQLDLTSQQQGQISQLVQTAQSNGTSSGTLLSQIDNVLSSSQQTQLAALLSPTSYNSSGSSTTTTLPYLVNTNA
jgi:Spy/CpxP family protein refolding chaperone